MASALAAPLLRAAETKRVRIRDVQTMVFLGGRTYTLVKVVSDEKFGEILGVHIIGPEAFELIGEAVAAMESEATVESMMNTIHAHPTLYEAIGEAFQNVHGLAINI